MGKVAYATGYGSKVHILEGDSSRMALCGVRTYYEWTEKVDPTPAELCKSCYSSAERDGLLKFTSCSHCGGTGKEPTVAPELSPTTVL